jgi:hypothetical protein
MKVKRSIHQSASRRVDHEPRPVPRVAVVRRIDSERPTRVWSLLLPPGFRPEEWSATEQRGLRSGPNA